MTRAEWKRYRAKWAREHPHYNRDCMRRARALLRQTFHNAGTVRILGVYVRPDYLRALR